jgi:hypothetical protein
VSTRGIDIRQETDRIVFRVSLKDSAGAKVTTGTTELRLYRLTDTGTLEVYDWTTNDFVATGAGTPDDETTMTQRDRRDSTGADVATGIWTVVLSTLTNFAEGQVYIAQATNSLAVPESQEREFQFGGVEGSSRFARAVNTIAKCTVGSGSTTTSVVSSACDPAGSVADQFKGRIMLFDKDTTTAALRGQATDITASSNAAAPTFTVTALTTAPVSGDTFVIQ